MAIDLTRKAAFEKAEITLADLTSNGGLLVTEQADKFIRTVQEQPTILNQVTMVPMRNPVKEWPKMQFGSMILVPASQADQSATGTSPYDGRYLPGNKWAKPITSKVTLSTVEMMAEIHIPYETLEDNIEHEGMKDTILALAAQRISQDMEIILITGDTTLNDGTSLSLIDGILKQSVTNVVDIGGDTLDPFAMTSIIKAMPQKYRDVGNVKFFTTTNAELDLRLSQASRNTNLGDASLTGANKLQFGGYMLDTAQKMPLGKGIFCDPKNIMVGMHRSIRMESMADIRAREWVFVMSLRWGVKIQEENAFVKFQNAAS